VGDGGARIVFVVDPDVDRDRDRASAPRRVDLHGDHDQVQAAGIDHAAKRGTHRVPEDPGAVHFGTVVVEQRVVTGKLDHPGGVERGDQVAGQDPPQPAHRPDAVADEPVVGVVGTTAGRVGDFDHVGDRAPARGADPSSHQVGEDREARRGEPRAGQVEQREKAGHRARRRSARAAAIRSVNAARPALACSSNSVWAAR